MAEKVIVENFENFEGLDASSTALTRKPTAFRTISNTRFGEGGSIRKRPGSISIGQQGYFLASTTYDYQNTTSGESEEELLAVNKWLWRLKSSSFSVSGLSNLSYSVLLNTAASEYRLVITNNGSALTFGSNQYISLNTYIGSVIETIDAHASLTCSAAAGLNYAKANGAQSGVATVTVDSGHTYVAGEWLDFQRTGTNFQAYKITSTTATTITIGASEIVVDDNEWLGALGAIGTSIPLTTATAVNSTLVIPFYYWEVVPWNTDLLLTAADYSEPPFLSPESVSFLNANNSCYIYYKDIDNSSKLWNGFPFKYDGQTLYREGVPKAVISSLSTGAGSLTGAYQYQVRFIQYDNRGKIIQGEFSDVTGTTLSADSSILTILNPSFDPEVPMATGATAGMVGIVNGLQTATTINVDAGHTIRVGDTIAFNTTATAAFTKKIITATTTTTITFSGSVTVADNTPIYRLLHAGFNMKMAIVNGAQSGVSTITVSSFSTANEKNTIELGDTIYFYDRATALYDTRVVTTKTDTTIGWSTGAAVNVNDGDVITNNFRVQVSRTKAGGNIFYIVGEAPVNWYTPTFTFTDDVVDSMLVARTDIPEIGYEPTLPPKCSFATVHNGIRVASGIIAEPNTIAVYDPINLESVPIGSGINFFDIASNIEGAISGLATDNNNSLAVFKPNAYYAVDGDILGGSASITTKTEGDYGIASHNSIQKINGAIFGVGNLGVLVVSNGQIIRDVPAAINPLIRNNTDYDLTAAFALNDYYGMGYWLVVPGESTTGGLTTAFFFDYDNNIWFQDTWNFLVAPCCSASMYEDRSYFITDDGYLHRELRVDSYLTTLSQIYADSIYAIERVMRFIYHLGTPSIDKEFLRLKLYSMYNPGEEDLYVTATVTVKTYKDFKTSTIDSQITLSFTSATQFEDFKKLKANKARALEFEIIDSNIHECLHLTGWEVVVEDGFRKEDIA